MDESSFYLKVAHALSGCQLVEQELKLYITEALELVKKCVDGKMPFGMTGEDYADASLERLIQTFKKLSNNSALALALTNFKHERNFLSHRAIAHCLDPEGELSDPYAQDVLQRLDRIQVDADRLRTALHDEANKFRAHLWFDDLGPSPT
jgi:hypothetical protein